MGMGLEAFALVGGQANQQCLEVLGRVGERAPRPRQATTRQRRGARKPGNILRFGRERGVHGPDASGNQSLRIWVDGDRGCALRAAFSGHGRRWQALGLGDGSCSGWVRMNRAPSDRGLCRKSFSLECGLRVGGVFLQFLCGGGRDHTDMLLQRHWRITADQTASESGGLSSAEDLVEAMAPFEVLVDCGRQLSGLGSTVNAEDGVKKQTKVVRDAEVALAALGTYDKALDNELQISTSELSLTPRPGSTSQLKIPCLFMRGGTSRGTYFLKHHLPGDRETIDKILLRVMGSPDNRQINGLGGATSVTSKVAILSLSEEDGVDIDYLFAQVAVNESTVDWGPSCGNMLAGVGPAAIEMGLITRMGDPVTPVKIRATNNGTLVEALVQTPGRELTYDGDASIDGVPGSAAPVTLNFMNVVGSKTGGKLLPTGSVVDTINGVKVTCLDVAMPLVIADATSLGKTGRESKAELDADRAFFERMEAIRLIAGAKMGLGDVRGRVIPKFAIVSKPTRGSITARYFVPDSTHPSLAVTGGICIGCCSILSGSVAQPVARETSIGPNKSRVVIEHPSGQTEVILDTERPGPGRLTVHSAGVVRTCRLLFEGFVYIRRAGLGPALESPGRDGQEKFREYQQRVHSDFRKLYRFEQTPDKDGQLKWVGDDGEEIAEDGSPEFAASAAVSA